MIGDALSDLPEVSSFSFAESLDYISPPQTPFQHFMRRPPPFHESSQACRAAAADRAMQISQQAERSKVCEGCKLLGGTEQVSAFHSECKLLDSTNTDTWIAHYITG